MSDLMIVAAGRGSRMRVDVPKALVPIVNEPCLTTTLQQIGNKFATVFIVVNKDITSQWEKYQADTLAKYPQLMQNVILVPIDSGLGDGHAVKEALITCAKSGNPVNEDLVVVWGDVFFPHAEIIDELLAHDMPGSISGIIPAVHEDNPYVTLLVDNNMRCMSADFSKYGECHVSGLHDQSVFRFKTGKLMTALNILHNSLWKNGRYMTQGGELSTLFVFHLLYNEQMPMRTYQTDYPTRSFNTPDEVSNLQTEIHEKWKSRFL